MKKITYFLFFMVFSCQYIDKKPEESDLLNSRLKEINWQKVDKLPMIDACNALKSEIDQQQCFYEFFEQTIKEKLQHCSNKKFHKNDTVIIKVMISNIGKTDFQAPNDTDLDSMVRTALIGFPKITPAIKQGMYVKTEFLMKIYF